MFANEDDDRTLIFKFPPSFPTSLQLCLLFMFIVIRSVRQRFSRRSGGERSKANAGLAKRKPVFLTTVPWVKARSVFR